MHYSSRFKILNLKYNVGTYFVTDKNDWRHYVDPVAYIPEKSHYHVNKENYDITVVIATTIEGKTP